MTNDQSNIQLTQIEVSRQDPLSEKYFLPLERADLVSTVIFYIVASLSIIVLIVDPVRYPVLNNILNVAFFSMTIVLFGIGLSIRLYFSPRAEDRRRLDFFSAAYDVALIDERTTGYYNNSEKNPVRGIAAQALENALFSKDVVLKMLHRERPTYVIYTLLWLIALANRQTELTYVVASAQALFSEQIIARWFRLEWLRSRFEDTYLKLHTLFVNGNKSSFSAYALAYITAYETTKSNAGILLSSSIFKKLNPSLSLKWTEVKQTLGL